MNALDIFVQNYFSSIRSSGLIKANYLISSVFDFSSYFLFLSGFVALLIYLVRGWKYMILFLSTICAGGVLVYFLKIFFNISRPADPVAMYFGQSFPSYHATMATVFFVLLMYIFDRYFKTLGKILFNTFCVTSILLVVISRVYLGAHWVSDVLSGVIFGVVFTYFSITIFMKYVTNVTDGTSVIK